MHPILRPFLSILAIGFLSVIARGASSTEEGSFAGFVAQGSPWQTPYYVSSGSERGPTVMIVGGIHGDEPAGARAADQIRHWPLERGRLIVVPRANVGGLAAFTRLMPHKSETISNLNRNFPRTGGPGEAASILSQSLWHLAEVERPDWLFDLHEGVGFRASGDDSVGSSVICFEDPEVDRMVALVLAAVNEGIEDSGRHFVRLRKPADGSLVRAAHERLDSHALILETTKKDQRLATRIRQHRIMVHAVLRELDMTEDEGLVDQLLARRRDEPSPTMRLAIFDAPGTGGPEPYEWIFTPWPDVVTQPIGVPEILSGALGQFDAIAFFGGSGSEQGKSLGEAGREQVRRFVDGGGGYLGICAGAYLATTDYSWSLGIFDAKVIDNENGKWARGTGTVRIEVAPEGRERLGESEQTLDIYYANGPILAPRGLPDLPDYRPLAWYRTEFAANGATPGVMLDSPAIIEGECGRGRVICFGCHPDKTRGLRHYLHAALRWVLRREASSSSR